MWPKAILEMDTVVEKAKEGDRNAFDKLHSLYKSAVYALCLRLTRDARDAEDLTQEVFLHVYRKVYSLRDEGAFGSWLYRVAKNVTMMHLRKRHLDELPLDVLESGNPSMSSRSRIGSHYNCDPVAHIALLRAVCGLSKGRRALIFLHDLEGLSHKEVAECFGVPVNTSKSQLYRTHRKLRAILTDTDMPTHPRITHRDTLQAHGAGTTGADPVRRDPSIKPLNPVSA